MTAATMKPGFALLEAITASVPPERLAFLLRVALAVAMLTVVFEKLLDIESNLQTGRYHLIGAAIGFAVATVLTPFERFSRIGILLFGVCIAVYLFEKWAAYHNHGYLTLWTIPIAAAFGWRWWESELYRRYLRATLGVVMLAACAQKLVAGTYLDGTFISYLSQHGDTTERMFGFMCAPGGSCFWHQAVGTFIMVWQAVVGLLLLLGVKSLIFLFVEIGFLLGAGLYADEMNFQVLNIALLCVAFGYGLRPWVGGVCLALLLVDAYSISAIANHAL